MNPKFSDFQMWKRHSWHLKMGLVHIKILYSVFFWTANSGNAGPTSLHGNSQLEISGAFFFCYLTFFTFLTTLISYFHILVFIFASVPQTGQILLGPFYWWANWVSIRWLQGYKFEKVGIDVNLLYTSSFLSLQHHPAFHHIIYLSTLWVLATY